MSATPQNVRIRGENAQDLTVLECVRRLEFFGCRSLTVQFDGAPMLVRVSLEFPKEELKPS